MQPSAIMTVNDVQGMIGKTLTVRAYVKALPIAVQVMVMNVRQRFGRVDYLLANKQGEETWVEAKALEVIS